MVHFRVYPQIPRYPESIDGPEMLIGSGGGFRPRSQIPWGLDLGDDPFWDPFWTPFWTPFLDPFGGLITLRDDGIQ